MNDIIHGPEPLTPRVIAVEPLPDHALRLTFTDNRQGLYDFKPMLSYPAYAPLKDERLFAQAYVAWGTVCWPGDIDCCPDRLYQDLRPAT